MSLMRVVLIAVGLALPAIGMAEPRAGARPTDIDQIEISGVTVFQGQEIQDVLEISPGEKFDRVKIGRSIENLEALYQYRGYEQVKIKVVQFKRKKPGGEEENVLEFAVSEGGVSRIAAIRFLASDVKGPELEKIWSKIEATLAARVELRAGDTLDQDKINGAKKAIQDVLAAEEFIGAKINEVKISQEPVPPQGDKNNRWIGVTFLLELGDRVTFGFRGNTIFTAAKLISLIEDQRVLGFGKDYIASIKARIEDEYRSLGHSKVGVSIFTFETPARHERHITYVITEGPRVTLRKVEFDGNTTFSSSELMEQFEKNSSVVLQHGYFVEKDIRKAADLMIEWIRSKGYLGAKLVAINMIQVPSSRAGSKDVAVDLVIYLYEGDQTSVGTVSLPGISVFSEAEVRKTLGITEGGPLNLFSFSEGIETLKAMYRNKGYLGVGIKDEGGDQIVRYSEENRLADIHLNVHEGPKFQVSKIVIDGMGLTRDHVLRRELLFKEGDVLEESKIEESEGRLRRMGIFSSVSIRPIDDPESDVKKIVKISVQEANAGVVAGGAGLRNDLGIRIFGQAAYTNLGGRNQTISLNTMINRRFQNFRFVEYQAQIGYLWPWFGGIKDLTFRPAFTVTGIQYIRLDATTVSASATWERPILRKPMLTGVLTYSLERILQFHSTVSAVDNQGLRIGTLTPSLRLDMRDNPLSPASGFFSQASLEYAAPWLFSQMSPYRVGYYRLQFRADYFLPLFDRKVIWYFSFRSGFERSNEEPVADPSTPSGFQGGIPVIKQFALGGAGSLRGYSEQELNVQEFQILGTLSYVNYRTQLDLPFAGALRFGPFLDAANLRRDSFSFGSLKYGAGFGFHYQTPVGPVNLDWGFKLNDRPGNQIYFSIGII